MAKRLDHILVIDVEATCWDGAPPPGQENEIIEIGICTVDVRQRRREGRESILVRPQRSRVSPFCTQLTTLTQADVDEGVSFEEACQLLCRKYHCDQRTWASFGDYDRNQFDRQCRAFGIRYPFGPTHLNVKNLLALCRGLHHEVGMDAALEMLGLPLEGTHHRGGDDAWNIAAVLLALLPPLMPSV
jgi:inhibitor of KinA sporulation pathway (predicted exonuclease)